MSVTIFPNGGDLRARRLRLDLPRAHRNELADVAGPGAEASSTANSPRRARLAADV